MVALEVGLSATRVAGLVAYSVSLALCASRCLRERRINGLYGILSLAQLVLLLDIVFDWRWMLHERLLQNAMAHGVYGARRPGQLLWLCILMGFVAAGVVLVTVKLQSRRGAAIAVIGTIFSVGLRCMEVVSYHWVDAVMYSRVGAVMLVGILWIALALFTCLGVWMDGRLRQPR
jgi:hypothetical protein